MRRCYILFQGATPSASLFQVKPSRPTLQHLQQRQTTPIFMLVHINNESEVEGRVPPNAAFVQHAKYIFFTGTRFYPRLNHSNCSYCWSIPLSVDLFEKGQNFFPPAIEKIISILISSKLDSFLLNGKFSCELFWCRTEEFNKHAPIEI